MDLHGILVWAGAPSSHLDMSDKLQKQVCRTVGPSVAASLEPSDSLSKYNKRKSFLWLLFC